MFYLFCLGLGVILTLLAIYTLVVGSGLVFLFGFGAFGFLLMAHGDFKHQKS